MGNTCVMSFHPNNLRLLRLAEQSGADSLCLGCGGWVFGSEGVADQMTVSALHDSWLKGDRTVFGLRHAASAVLFK